MPLSTYFVGLAGVAAIIGIFGTMLKLAGGVPWLVMAGIALGTWAMFAVMFTMILVTT